MQPASNTTGGDMSGQTPAACNPARVTDAAPRCLVIGGREFVWGARTYIMAAVNITPDSFSGDGVMAAQADWVQAAADAALRAEDEGADIVDIGGESTRPRSVYPDARPVSAAAEMARVLPVIRLLKGRLGLPVSIDTRKADVARAALTAGASLVNDVSMLGDPDMASVAAGAGVPIVVSHTRPKAVYGDVVSDVISDLSGAIGRALQAGVEPQRIIVDPGIGFAKKPEHSLEVLRRLRELRELGHPVLVGTSRKSFIGAVLDLPPQERLEGTAATVAISVANGADIVRVHDVRAMLRVSRMADALVRGWPARPTA